MGEPFFQEKKTEIGLVRKSGTGESKQNLSSVLQATKECHQGGRGQTTPSRELRSRGVTKAGWKRRGGGIYLP